LIAVGAGYWLTAARVVLPYAGLAAAPVSATPEMLPGPRARQRAKCRTLTRKA
jgi:hypothetical protein